MAVSGTTSFAPEITDLLEEASARAGVDVRGGEEYRGAMRALNLMLIDLNNRGLNLFAIEQVILAVTANDAEYTLPADTMDLISSVWRDDNGIDTRIERMGVGTWASISNKSQVGNRPTRLYVERLVAAPVVHLWPVPQVDGDLVYWRLRRLNDAGNPDNTIDVNYRFWPAMACGWAYFLALQHPEIPLDRVAFLNQNYENTLAMAMEEDRDRSSFYIGIWTKRV